MSGFGGFKLKFQVLHSNLKVMVNFNHIFRTWCPEMHRIVGEDPLLYHKG